MFVLFGIYMFVNIEFYSYDVWFIENWDEELRNLIIEIRVVILKLDMYVFCNISILKWFVFLRLNLGGVNFCKIRLIVNMNVFLVVFRWCIIIWYFVI